MFKKLNKHSGLRHIIRGYPRRDIFGSDHIPGFGSGKGGVGGTSKSIRYGTSSGPRGILFVFLRLLLRKTIEIFQNLGN